MGFIRWQVVGHYQAAHPLAILLKAANMKGSAFKERIGSVLERR